MTDVSNVFQYGASESNGRSMGYEEQLQKSPETGEVPSQRAGEPFDSPAESHIPGRWAAAPVGHTPSWAAGEERTDDEEMAGAAAAPTAVPSAGRGEGS